MLLVTALYDIDGGSLSFDRYLEELSKLLSMGVPFWVYCDPAHRTRVEACVPDGADVVVMAVPLSEFRMYSMIMQADPALPLSRSPGKDTLAYLALINTKLEFTFRAAVMRPKEPMLAFIDAGITHVIKDLDLAGQRLRALGRVATERALFPGIHASQALGPEASMAAVSWRFCGGFFASPASLLPELCSCCEEVVRQLLDLGRISWEVNVWAVAEQRGAPIEWYAGGHDDRLLNWPGAPQPRC
jgi:hypothetical protein